MRELRLPYNKLVSDDSNYVRWQVVYRETAWPSPPGMNVQSFFLLDILPRIIFLEGTLQQLVAWRVDLTALEIVVRLFESEEAAQLGRDLFEMMDLMFAVLNTTDAHVQDIAELRSQMGNIPVCVCGPQP